MRLHPRLRSLVPAIWSQSWHYGRELSFVWQVFRFADHDATGRSPWMASWSSLWQLIDAKSSTNSSRSQPWKPPFRIHVESGRSSGRCATPGLRGQWSGAIAQRAASLTRGGWLQTGNSRGRTREARPEANTMLWPLPLRLERIRLACTLALDS